MTTTRKHYAVFYSPGTFCAEESEREVREWNPHEAMKHATEIVERHGARPYGFRFATRIVADPIADGEGGQLTVEPKTVAKSGMHFILGKVETVEEVEARNDPKEEILRSNMRCNDWDRIVTTTTSYRWTQPFRPGDCVVDADGNITARHPEAKS